MNTFSITGKETQSHLRQYINKNYNVYLVVQKKFL